jgi:hypothetical protein
MAELDDGLFLCDAEPSGGLGDFDDTTDPYNILTTTSGEVNNGGYAYRVTYSGTSAQTAYAIMAASSVSSLYFRMYVYIPSTIRGSLNYKYIQFCRFNDSGNSEIARLGVQCDLTPWEYDKWLLQTWPSGTAQTSTEYFATDTWVRLEGRFINDATSGGVVMRIDGNQVLASTTENTSSFYCDEVRIGSISNSDPATGDKIYFDDCKAYTSDWVGAYQEAPTGAVPVIAYKHFRDMRE